MFTLVNGTMGLSGAHALPYEVLLEFVSEYNIAKRRWRRLCVRAYKYVLGCSYIYARQSVAAVNESESRGDVLIALALRLARRALYKQHTRLCKKNIKCNNVDAAWW